MRKKNRKQQITCDCGQMLVHEHYSKESQCKEVKFKKELGKCSEVISWSNFTLNQIKFLVFNKECILLSLLSPAVSGKRKRKIYLALFLKGLTKFWVNNVSIKMFLNIWNLTVENAVAQHTRIHLVKDTSSIH